MYPLLVLISQFFPPVAWIHAQDIVVMETVGLVDMQFMITRGDRSIITRAFAVIRSLSATEGIVSVYFYASTYHCFCIVSVLSVSEVFKCCVCT